MNGWKAQKKSTKNKTIPKWHVSFFFLFWFRLFMLFFSRLCLIFKMYWTECSETHDGVRIERFILFYFFSLLVPHSVSMTDNIKPNQEGLFDLLFFNIICVLLLLWSLHSSVFSWCPTKSAFYRNVSPIFFFFCSSPCMWTMSIECSSVIWCHFWIVLLPYALPLFRQLSDPISFSIQHDK